MFEQHEILRHEKKWGTYGKSGDLSLRIVPIYKISNSHLENIIIYIRSLPTYFTEQYMFLLTEKKYREFYNIFVPEYIVTEFKFLTENKF